MGTLSGYQTCVENGAGPRQSEIRGLLKKACVMPASSPGSVQLSREEFPGEE
jgi:hypothetical protein